MTKRQGPKCGGKLHRRDGTCTQPAGWGTDHVGHGRCKLHGGCSPSGRAAGLTARALAELDRLDVEPVGNPLEQLVRLAGRARKWEEILSAQMAELTSLTYQTDGGAEQLRAIVPLWERSLDRCAQFCAVMAKLGIDQRIIDIQVAVARQTGGEFAWYLAEILRELSLSAAQQARVPEIVPRIMRSNPPAESQLRNWHWKPDQDGGPEGYMETRP